jgi:glycosyltransferase involved in cell wall biosynthesis
VPASVPGHPIRVVRLFSRLNIGGPAVHVILLTAGLRELGYETRLLVGQESAHEGNLLDLARQHAVVCEQVPGFGREIRIGSDLRALWSLVRTIRRFRPAIVHTHTAKAGLLGRVAARISGVPVVVHTFHGHVLSGYFGPVRNALFRTLEAWLARTCDALIAVSESVRGDLVALRVAPAERIRVIPLGLELDALARTLPRGGLRRESGVPDDVPLVGIVGRLAPIKDIPTFLRAAQRVREKDARVRFAIVGDGEERPELERLVDALGLRAAVHFHGWRRDMDAVYGDLDVAVNCSRNEGTPVALIEALAAGRPVVATAVGGTPDLLHRGDFGRLVPAGDDAQLAAAIVEAITDPAPATARAAAGRRYVLAKHSSRRLAADIDALYRELLARRAVAVG